MRLLSDVPHFTKGRKLCREFYHEIIAPLVVGKPHSAALLGEGSEVLGLDTVRSTDHGWGPRLQLFVQSQELEKVRTIIERELPETFRGWPTRFYRWQSGKVEHHVEVTTVDSWLKSHFGFDPRMGMAFERWLAVSQQILMEFTDGQVFRDDFGDLTSLQGSLAWYPRDVWLWLLASQWKLIADKESFVGRAMEVGDDLGARIIAAELNRDIIRLWLLQERRYAPYRKWLGTLFSQLANVGVHRALHEVLQASDQKSREAVLCKAYESVAVRQNDLGLTRFVEPCSGAFEVQIAGAVRPYIVLNAERFVGACREAIEDKRLRRLEPVGGIDQLTHASDLLVKFTPWPDRLASTYRELAGAEPGD